MTVRMLSRALDDFEPSAAVTLDGNRLVIGKGFYLDIPVAKKTPKRETAPKSPQTPPPEEPGLFAPPGETKVN